MDRGEAGRGLDVETGDGQGIARDPLRVGDRDVVELALDGGQRRIDGGEGGVEAREVGAERRRVLRRRPGQRRGDGGGDGWHPRDVVPEVRVGVAAPGVEHGRGGDDPRVAAVGAQE